MTAFSSVFHLVRPAVPVVREVAPTLFRSFISQPHVQAIGMWLGGLTAVSQVGVVRNFVSPPPAENALVSGLGVRTAAITAAAVLSGACLVRWVRNRSRENFELVNKPHSFESLVDGSVEVDMEPAASQFYIGQGSSNNGPVIDIVGGGVRVDVGTRAFVVTAGHNVARGGRLFLTKKGEIQEIPETALRYELAADAVAIEVSAALFSKLGVSKATLAFQPNQAYVSITGLTGKGTNGKLKLIPEAFGRLQYMGTTRAGYSGCPYFSGKGIYGIHTNGGVANEGFSLAFLYQLLKLELGVRDEGDYTFSWFQKFLGKRGEKLIYHKGDDVIMIDDDGYVYSLPKSKHEEYVRQAEMSEAYRAGREEYDDFVEDVIPESLNYQRPGPSRAGRRSHSVPPSAEERSRPVRILESLRQSVQHWTSLPNELRNVARVELGLKPRKLAQPTL